MAELEAVNPLDLPDDEVNDAIAAEMARLEAEEIARIEKAEAEEKVRIEEEKAAEEARI